MKKSVDLLIQLADHKHDGLGRLFLDPVAEPELRRQLREYLGAKIVIKQAQLDGQRLRVTVELPDYQAESDNLVRLARGLLERRRPHAALDQLNEALRLFPLNGTALKHLGRERYREADYGAAAGFFVRANEVLREDAEALRALGTISLREGREPSAVAYFERASAANPADPAARDALAQLRARIADRFGTTPASAKSAAAAPTRRKMAPRRARPRRP